MHAASCGFQSWSQRRMRLVLESIIHKHLGDGGRRCPIEFAKCLSSRLKVQSIAVGHESVRSNARLASGLMARATWGRLIPRQARLQSLIWVSSPPLLSSVLARLHARPHACLRACLQARLHPPTPADRISSALLRRRRRFYHPPLLASACSGAHAARFARDSGHLFQATGPRALSEAINSDSVPSAVRLGDSGKPWSLSRLPEPFFLAHVSIRLISSHIRPE